MPRKASDLIWLGAIAAIVAGGMWFARSSLQASSQAGVTPTVRFRVANPACADMAHEPGQRFSIRGIYIGMPGRAAFEVNDAQMRRELDDVFVSTRMTGTHLTNLGLLPQLLPQFDLDENLQVISVSGQDADDHGVRVVQEGQPVPASLNMFQSFRYSSITDGRVTLGVRLDARLNVVSTTLTGINQSGDCPDVGMYR